MNANELADALKSMESGWFDDLTLKEAATMLRQQQLRINQLLETQTYLYKMYDTDKAEIEELKKEAALQRLSDFTQDAQRTSLTDQDILKMAADKFHYSEYKLVIDFARAILKKASNE